jgi:6-methylsalicylate decarboxylase
MTIDTHHHILPDFFWQATENAHAPVGGLAPLQWSKETSISFMDDAGIDFAVVSQIALTGDSAGGNLALALLSLASVQYGRDRYVADKTDC